MRFRFQLGENQIYARNFEVAMYRGQFLEIEGSPEDVVLPVERFDGLVAAYVMLSHPVERRIPVVSLEREVVRYASHQYKRGFIRVEGTFEHYLESLTSNKRSQLRRKVKKFRERSGGKARFEVFEKLGEMREFHRLARQIAPKTYQEKLFHKGLPEHEAFVREMEERANLSPPCAHGYVLFLDDQPIAYLYATVDEGFLTYDYVGYDPAHSELSPGNVLQYMILERVFADKTCKVFDFGEGESQYKEFFSTDSVPCADLYWFPRDPLGYALFGSQAGMYFVSRGIVQTLDKLGLKQRVKNLMRGHVPRSSVGKSFDRNSPDESLASDAKTKARSA